MRSSLQHTAFLKFLHKNTTKTLATIILSAILVLAPGLNLQTHHAHAELVELDSEYVFFDDEFVSQPFIPTDTESRTDIIEYTVSENDTLASLANDFGISETTILWTNKLKSAEDLKPGTILRILPVTGILYTTKSHENIEAIAWKFRVSSEIIKHQNNLEDGSELTIGQELIIPGAIRPRPIRDHVIATNRRSYGPISNPGYPPIDAPTRLVKPATGQYTQKFSWRHYGVDIADPSAPPVYAAESGCVARVKYSGWNGGYGEYIMLDHGDGLRTIYAHLREEFLKDGECVKRGQAIALMGSTGKSTGTHVHFEVIKNGRKVDPLDYL